MAPRKSAHAASTLGPESEIDVCHHRQESSDQRRAGVYRYLATREETLATFAPFAEQAESTPSAYEMGLASRARQNRAKANATFIRNRTK